MHMGKMFNLLVGFAVSMLGKQISAHSRREDIEKAKALMQVADLHLTRFNKSRDIEWFVNISFWALAAAAGGFLIEKVPAESLPVFSRRGIFFFLLGPGSVRPP